MLNLGLTRAWLQGWSRPLSSNTTTLSQALYVGFITPPLLWSSLRC